MNALVTGVSGSGKTTIAFELAKRGYNAINMDSVEGLSSWVDLSTGQPEPDFGRESLDNWVDKYDRLWNVQKLKELLDKKADTYFCGSSGNQRELYHLFDKVFLLEMDEELIRDRILSNERDHDYGQKPGEIDLILGYYKDFQDGAKAIGAIVIDAHKPVNEVIDQVLAETIGL